MEFIRKLYLDFFRAVDLVSEKLAQISMLVSYVLLVSVTSITLLGVFYRYVLNSPLRWPEEVARYLLVWLALVAASVATRKRLHISLTTVTDRLPCRVVLCIEIVFSLLVVIILGVLTWHAWVMVSTRSLRLLSPSLQVSMAWAHGAMPVGLGLITFQTFYILLDDIRLLWTEGASIQSKEQTTSRGL